MRGSAKAWAAAALAAAAAAGAARAGEAEGTRLRVDVYHLTLRGAGADADAREALARKASEAPGLDGAVNALSHAGSVEYLGSDGGPVGPDGTVRLEVGRAVRSFMTDLPPSRGGRAPGGEVTTGIEVAARRTEIAGTPGLAYVIEDVRVGVGSLVSGDRGGIQPPRIEVDRTAGAVAERPGHVAAVVTRDPARQDGVMAYLIGTE